VSSIEWFDQLLDRLGKHLEKEMKCSLGRGRDDKLLGEAVSNAFAAYEVVWRSEEFSEEAGRLNTLHLLGSLLPEVIKILKTEENYDGILVRLGAPALPASSAEQKAVDKAAVRYDALMTSLTDIARDLPSPVKRGRGRPGAKDLRALVNVLADY
jgi:hypothetical protein